MASEDSVRRDHSTGEVFNSLQSFFRQMLASLHDGDHLGKTFEARSFYRSEWMCLEKLDDFVELFDASDSQFLSITMIW